MEVPSPEELAGWPAEARELYERRLRQSWGKPRLVERLRRRISDGGPLPFADFMAQALYDPEEGYYASSGPWTGERGDFLTSPTLHPAFGASLGEATRRLWVRAGRPSPWTVVEMGPGGGELARSLLAWSAAAAEADAGALAYGEALRYVLVDPHPQAQSLQERRLRGLAPAVSWLARVEDLAPGSVVGVLLSNELVDALPVHRLRFRDGRLEELYVAAGPGGFEEVWAGPSSPTVRRAASRLRPRPPEDQPFELGLAARAWLRACARALGRGYLLTLDYGEEAESLYSGRYPGGTLMAYRRHGTGSPLAAVGYQDLTSRVDFTALRRVGRACGLWSAPLVTQRDLLLHLGWPPASPPSTARAVPSATEALRALVDPEGLGAVKVLLQGKGVAPAHLSDL